MITKIRAPLVIALLVLLALPVAVSALAQSYYFGDLQDSAEETPGISDLWGDSGESGASSEFSSDIWSSERTIAIDEECKHDPSSTQVDCDAAPSPREN